MGGGRRNRARTSPIYSSPLTRIIQQERKITMKLRSRLAAMAGFAAAVTFAAALWADGTPAMDRTPAAAPVVVSVKNVPKVLSSLSARAAMFNKPGEPLPESLA